MVSITLNIAGMAAKPMTGEGFSVLSAVADGLAARVQHRG
jgi:hypothetical protein